jgi:hypothetical protein
VWNYGFTHSSGGVAGNDGWTNQFYGTLLACDVSGLSGNNFLVGGYQTKEPNSGARTAYLNGGPFLASINPQTLAANGAVTIDAAKGEFHKILLNANATSTTISNPSFGQKLTIEWKQDGTGSRTVVWPTNCVFAGGAAPTTSTVANYRDIVSFICEWNGTTYSWVETSRSIAVR